MSEEKWIPKPKKSPVKRVKEIYIYKDRDATEAFDVIALFFLIAITYFFGLYTVYRTPDPLFKSIICFLGLLIMLLISGRTYTKETYIEE